MNFRNTARDQPDKIRKLVAHAGDFTAAGTSTNLIVLWNTLCAILGQGLDTTCKLLKYWLIVTNLLS